MEYNDENLLALHAKGWSYAEIARELNVTRSTVGGRLLRIRLARVGGLPFPKRRQGVNPNGRTQDYGVRKQPDPASYPRAVPVRVTSSMSPNWLTIGPRRRAEMTKAEMYEMLRKAVENTR